MNIHEYQAKALLGEHGVNVPRGGVAYTPEEAVAQAEELGGPVWVVKAQIHAGGRGKGGGVKVVKSIDEVKEVAGHLIGMNLVTHQTSAEGKEVKRVYVEEGCDIAREFYLSFLVDRATSRVAIMASTEGGMDIEEVAEATPEKILTIFIDPATGIMPFHCRQLAFALGLSGKQVGAAGKLFTSLYNAFLSADASLLEINPLVVTGSDDIIPLDAKMSFDDNALFRHQNIADLRDPDEEDPMELEAAKHELNYIKLDGNIGCMVNGAGLAMATMDIIKLYGENPANFLDVGGGATKERVTEAFKIILSDSNVKAVLVNIFGGIVRCDLIAEGIIGAVKEVGVNVPVVVRLEGNNADLGAKVLAESGLDIIAATSLTDAAQQAVKAANA
jgi:succinyl-CoA synthetase beta subunit